MRSVFSLIFLAFACPSALLFAGLLPVGVTPTATPPMPVIVTVAAPAPFVQISADATQLQVGDTVTITGVPVNIGIPYYTLALSSGATMTVTYTNQVRDASSDAQFEIVSATAEMNQVTFVLRALAPGTVQAVISATGEVTSPEGAFSWSYGTSEPLELVVST